MREEASSAEQGSALLALARAALESELESTGAWLEIRARIESSTLGGWLGRPGACFVTLRSGPHLRGCIGSLEAVRPLIDDVHHNALAAASRDPRFEPVRAHELARLTLEISLLGPQQSLDFGDEAEAQAILRPHIDGVILRYGEQRSTFLPQVWEELPTPAAFLAQLKRKAGLPEDFWHSDLELARYRVLKWSERKACGPGESAEERRLE